MGIRDKNIDRAGGLSPRYIRWRLKEPTANYTITKDDAGVMFTNRGLSGVDFTLPAATPDLAGMQFMFVHVAGAANSIFTAANADELVAGGSSIADAVEITTGSGRNGNGFLFICDGTQWLALCMLYQTALGTNSGGEINVTI